MESADLVNKMRFGFREFGSNGLHKKSMAKGQLKSLA